MQALVRLLLVGMCAVISTVSAQTTSITQGQIERLFANKQPQIAMAQLQRAAFAGQSWAQIWMGDLHLEGQRLQQSIVHSVDWYSQAAQLGDINAQLKLSDLFCDSPAPTLQNGPKCLYWLQQLSQQSVARAQFKLASFHFRDQFNQGDFAQALRLSELAQTSQNTLIREQAIALNQSIQNEIKKVDKKAPLLDAQAIENRFKRKPYTIRLAVFNRAFDAQQFALSTDKKNLYRYQVQALHIVAYDAYSSVEAAQKALAKLLVNENVEGAVIVPWQQVLENLNPS